MDKLSRNVGTQPKIALISFILLTSDGCNHEIYYSYVIIYLLSLGQRMVLPYCHLYVCTVVDCLCPCLSCRWWWCEWEVP